jgi:hypothetical protein
MSCPSGLYDCGSGAAGTACGVGPCYVGSPPNYEENCYGYCSFSGSDGDGTVYTSGCVNYENVPGGVFQACSVTSPSTYGTCCDQVGSTNPTATNATQQVVAPYWNNATQTSLQKLSNNIDSEQALYELCASTAGTLALNETDENRINNAVTMTCYVLILNIEKIKSWWDQGKKIATMTNTNREIFDNSHVADTQVSHTSQYTFKNASSFNSRSPFYYKNKEKQWVFRGGDYNITSLSTQEKEAEKIVGCQSTLNQNIYIKQNEEPKDYTVSYGKKLSSEISKMQNTPANNPTSLINIDDIIIETSVVYRKTINSNLAFNSLVVSHRDVGVVSLLFLEE